MSRVREINDRRYYDFLPVGYRFDPTDVELIRYYLIRKIMRQTLPIDRIREVNLYAFATPERLTERFELIKERESKWYFFTPRYKKYLRGDRPDRCTPGGYWKPTGADINVRSNGRIIGKKKALCFYEGKPMAGKKTDWIMYEYRVDRPSRRTDGTMKLDEWVLCRIHQNRTNTSERTISHVAYRVNLSSELRATQQNHYLSDHANLSSEVQLVQRNNRLSDYANFSSELQPVQQNYHLSDYANLSSALQPVQQNYHLSDYTNLSSQLQLAQQNHHPLLPTNQGMLLTNLSLQQQLEQQNYDPFAPTEQQNHCFWPLGDPEMHLTDFNPQQQLVQQNHYPLLSGDSGMLLTNFSFQQQPEQQNHYYLPSGDPEMLLTSLSPCQPSEQQNDYPLPPTDPEMLLTNLSPQQQPIQQNHCPLPPQDPGMLPMPDNADQHHQPIQQNQDLSLNLDKANFSWQDLFNLLS